MADTTITVSTQTHDRLAEVAEGRGITIGELVAQFVAKRPTRKERADSTAATVAYIREHFLPDFGDADIEATRQMLRDIEAGRRRSLG